MLRVPLQSETAAARVPSAVVVGRIGAGREYWRSECAGADEVRHGTCRTIDLLRARPKGQTSDLELLGGTSLTWEPGAPLGGPLERLGWRSGEPVVLAVPTPGIMGGALSVRVPVSAEVSQESHPDGSTAVDVREYMREARWKVREQFLAAAQRFFDCSLERAVVLAEEFPHFVDEGAGRSTHVTLQCVVKHAVGTRAADEIPVDLPDTQLVLFPLMMGELFRTQPGRVGFVIMEEERLTYILWRAGQMYFLRSFPLGAGLLLSHLMYALGCSPREGRSLLSQADCGAISPEAQRLLTKTFRPILPLFGGVWRILEEELADLQRPSRCIVAGYWPTALLRMMTRTSFQSRCLATGGTLHMYSRATHVLRADAETSAVPYEPSAGLLYALATVVIAHRAEDSAHSHLATRHQGIRNAVPAIRQYRSHF